MVIVIPLGHEVRLRRLPKATIGLIAVNVVVFLLTWFVMKAEMKSLAEKQRQLIMQGISYLVESESNEADPMGFLFTLPELRKKAKTPDTALAFLVEKLEPHRKKYKDWFEEYEEFKTLEKNLLIKKLGFVPADFPSLGVITHMFVHAGWLHIILNMWFLYLVGICLEDVWGRFNFLGFYFLGGLAAALLQYLFSSGSHTPMVGASGAVAAVMGAFAVRYATQNIDCLLLAFFFVYPIVRRFLAPAWLLLILWFGAQLFFAEMYRGIGEEGSVAFWSHVGGFMFGAGFASVLKLGKIEEKVIQPRLDAMSEYQEDFIQDGRLIVALDFMAKQKYDEALARVEGTVRDQPDNLDALIIKARLLFLKDSKEKSREMFLDIMKTARAGADRNMLATLYTEFREKFKGATLPENLVFSAGRACYEKGDAENARRALESLQGPDASPDLAARALFFLGRVEMELEKNTAEARKAFETFLDKYPDHPWTTQARDFLSKLGG